MFIMICYHVGQSSGDTKRRANDMFRQGFRLTKLVKLFEVGYMELVSCEPLYNILQMAS